MGKPTAVARRGAKGEVEYEVRNEQLEQLAKASGHSNVVQAMNHSYSRQATQRAKDAALRELYSREEAEIQARTKAMYGAASSPSGHGTSTHTEGNPGQNDTQSDGAVDLSTSDTTLRRRGGYRRDGGIRI